MTRKPRHRARDERRRAAASTSPASPAATGVQISTTAREAAMRQAVHAAQQLLGGALDQQGGAAIPQPTAYTGEHGAGGNAPLRRAIWMPVARNADADTLRTLPLQRAQSRELARTHPIAVGAMGTYLDRVVGTGLALVAAPDRRVLGWTVEQAAEWKTTVQAEFSLYADSTECDIRRTATFYALQRLVAGARAESGDCFTVLPDGAPTATMPYRLRLQVIEADRVGNPANAQDTAQVAGGIRRDPNGAPTAAHVYDQHPGTILPTTRDRWAGTWVDYLGPRSGRRRILHHWQPTRPEQTRGVPWFSPIIALLKDLDTYTDAEIKAAVVSAFLTVFITNNSGNAAPVFGMTDAAVAAAAGEVQMGPGAVVGLAKGEDVEVADPTRPNPAFEKFVEAILVQIGMALSIPFELLLKRFNASYSASRAALLDAWVYFRTQRTWLANSFCQPVYETWLAEAVALGRITAPGFFTDPLLRWAYTRAAWHGDSMGSINPKDEVAAYRDAIDGALVTHERAAWELFGTDWTSTIDTSIAEHDRLDDAGLLPPPKPGAAAPAGDAPGQPPAAPADQSGAALASVPPAPPPVVNVTLPDNLVQLEAHIHTPEPQAALPAPPAPPAPRPRKPVAMEPVYGDDGRITLINLRFDDEPSPRRAPRRTTD